MPILSKLFSSKSRISSGPPSPTDVPKSPSSVASSSSSSRRLFAKAPPPPPLSYTRPMDWFDGETLKPQELKPSSSSSSSKLRGKGGGKGEEVVSSVVGGIASEEDGSGVISNDPALEPWKWYLTARYEHFLKTLNRLSATHPKGLEGFCSAYETMGLIINADSSITYTEFAEDIAGASLIGDFNSWNPSSHPMALASSSSSYWSVRIPANADGVLPIPIHSEVKVRLRLKNGETVDRFPAYLLRATQQQDPPESNFRARMEKLPPRYKGVRLPIPRTPRIYEAHIGAATSQDNAVGTFAEFERDILPRVKAGGYNTLQLMGIMEHPYYASYGYQVSSYYAVSSRFGSIESLVSLIEEAHQSGIRVILDVVHSHSCSNLEESLNEFNGTEGMYFREGKEGRHSVWGTRIFDYKKTEVIRFLLSNLHFCVDRLGFDGFRFDSVSSMLFKDHAIDRAFYGDYGDYFSSNTDHEGVEYLMLANHMLSTLFPFITTIAEDFAGFPTLCLPTRIGGLGFNYRLGLGNPNFWFGLLKEGVDESTKWKVTNIVASLGNRRAQLGENSIAFAESHDECIEGGKTISHWLFDSDIYSNMSLLQPPTPRVERGLALHKLIRLMTCAFAGEGYMTFMGNEFGHPEWLEFPSVANGFQSSHAKRQWGLSDPERSLRFSELGTFDKQMMWSEERGGWGSGNLAHVFTQDDSTGLIVFLRSSHLFLVNFHPTRISRAGKYPVPEHWNKPGHYKVVLSTDGGLAGTQVTSTGKLDVAPLSALVVARFNNAGGMLKGGR
ncbi:glycoside hydrolase superfamily [Mrakia frigida]|uniref:glycoside hydrolase superfamily n=1 Tax=Mrakia frigida TaxID=29902 RepID=UPI003FCC1DE8